jgi:hypothetical protein
MAVIEELPDGVKDTNLNGILQKRVEEEYEKSNDNATASKNNGDTAPELPAPLAEAKNQSVDEFVKSLNKMPFFMTEMDETADDGGENEALEALKALAYEGTPEEVRCYGFMTRNVIDDEVLLGCKELQRARE